MPTPISVQTTMQLGLVLMLLLGAFQAGTTWQRVGRNESQISTHDDLLKELSELSKGNRIRIDILQKQGRSEASR